jgi:hypothetical protein
VLYNDYTTKEQPVSDSLMSAGICILMKIFFMAVKGNFPRRWLWIPGCILFMLILFSLIPLPKAAPGNCVKVMSKVVKIEPGTGEGDIVLTLANDDAYYYINRGLEYGIKMDVLKVRLLNKEVSLYYIKHWSMLNINGKTRHLARIEVDDALAYNEWPED